MSRHIQIHFLEFSLSFCVLSIALAIVDLFLFFTPIYLFVEFHPSHEEVTSGDAQQDDKKLIYKIQLLFKRCLENPLTRLRDSSKCQQQWSHLSNTTGALSPSNLRHNQVLRDHKLHAIAFSAT